MYLTRFKATTFDRASYIQKWIHVTDMTLDHVGTKINEHKKQFYIPQTSESNLQEYSSEFFLDIAVNPIGDGNCQFSDVAHQLQNIGIHRSAMTLRHEVVDFLLQSPTLGRQHLIPWSSSLTESRQAYLSRIRRMSEYGDQITLQAVAQIFHVQFLIVSTHTRLTTLLNPYGSNVFL